MARFSGSAEALKIAQTITPSSRSVVPVTVTVAVAGVTLVAVVHRNAPASASRSSVRFAHAFTTVSVAHEAQASIPPPVGIVALLALVNFLVRVQLGA